MAVVTAYSRQINNDDDDDEDWAAVKSSNDRKPTTGKNAHLKVHP